MKSAALASLYRSATLQWRTTCLLGWFSLCRRNLAVEQSLQPTLTLPHRQSRGFSSIIHRFRKVTSIQIAFPRSPRRQNNLPTVNLQRAPRIAFPTLLPYCAPLAPRSPNPQGTENAQEAQSNQARNSPKVIKPFHPQMPEKTEIAVDGAGHLYREIRMKTLWKTHRGKRPGLRKAQRSMSPSRLTQKDTGPRTLPASSCNFGFN